MGYEYFKRQPEAPGYYANAGGLDTPVATAATGTTLVSYGSHLLTGTSDTPNYVLAAPQAGRGVFIVASVGATSSADCTVTLAAGVSIQSSASTAATLRKITFADGDDAIMLHGISTAKYAIVSSFGSPTVGTT